VLHGFSWEDARADSPKAKAVSPKAGKGKKKQEGWSDDDWETDEDEEKPAVVEKTETVGTVDCTLPGNIEKLVKFMETGEGSPTVRALAASLLDEGERLAGHIESTLSDDTKKLIQLMDTGEGSPTARALAASLLDESERLAIVQVVEDSKISGGIKRCFICGREVRGGLKSTVHSDCPHVACTLECMLKMDVEFVGIKHDLLEGDMMMSASAFM